MNTMNISENSSNLFRKTGETLLPGVKWLNRLPEIHFFTLWQTLRSPCLES